MKLKEAVSRLMGTLQSDSFPHSEECSERPLTEKEQQLTSISSLLAMEPFGDCVCPQGGRSEAARAPGHSPSLECKSVYNHHTTCARL